MRTGPRHLRPGNPRRRMVGILAVLVLLFGVVVARLLQLQVSDTKLLALGESQRMQPIALPAQRGSVFDRNGADLAISVPQQTVWADPRLVVAPQATADQLAPVLGVDADVLLANLTKPGAQFVYLKRQVTDEVAAAVKALELDGIATIAEPKRFRPSGTLGQSILGVVDVDNKGITGLEQQYDADLTGVAGELRYERDPLGRTIAAGRQQITPALPGDDLVLSIDQAMQFQAEQAIANAMEANGAKGGIAIVQNPKTGEIYAMASVTRDATTGEPISSANNMALTTVFEPGSAAKVITMAAALEEGVVGNQATLVVPDSIQVADTLFKDHDPHPTQTMSLTKIMAESSNVGTIMLGKMLGRERVDGYQRAFGFGATTAIAFPNESAGIMLPLDKWSGTSIATIPIGQGISVTALQMLQAFNVIANGGEYVAPKLVQSTIDEHGTTHPTEPSERHQVVSPGTAAAVRDTMVAVVDGGTGGAAAIDGYSVAGKTGTARKSLDTGGYMDASGAYHYVTTFAGFVPAEDPELSIIVVLDEPTTDIYASGTAAPVFREIGSYALRRLEIPPPTTKVASVVPPLDTTTTVPPVAGSTTRGSDGRVRQAPAESPSAVTTPPRSTSTTGTSAPSGSSTTTTRPTSTTTKPTSTTTKPTSTTARPGR